MLEIENLFTYLLLFYQQLTPAVDLCSVFGMLWDFIQLICDAPVFKLQLDQPLFDIILIWVLLGVGHRPVVCKLAPVLHGFCISKERLGQTVLV